MKIGGIKVKSACTKSTTSKGWVISYTGSTVEIKTAATKPEGADAYN